MKIVNILESTRPIRSDIRNAYIDFSKMTLSVVAVVTDVIREGRPVIGYGFNSNGRYGQGGLIRERFAPRLLEADPQSLVDDAGENLDPHRIWARMMTNEKPGGHGERSVAVGTIDMAVWDAVAKIADRPLFRLLVVAFNVVGLADPARSEVSVDRRRRFAVELTPRPFRARTRRGQNGVERFTERDRRLPSRRLHSGGCHGRPSAYRARRLTPLLDRGSEVATSLEVLGDLRSRQLIERDPVASGRRERAAGAVRDLERVHGAPSA